MRSFAILILIQLLPAWPLYAQFSSKGSIDFTRSVNMRLSMQLEASDEFKNSTYFKEQIKKTPTNYATYFKMSFNEQASQYFFDKAGEVATGMFWDNKVAAENTVIQDFVQHKLTAQKEIYEKNYIINDSLPRYQWKIHDDVREIAGYQCRKATTVINDSVVVVAYYTDQILVSSGPESFGGLPGMILGLAIPRLYTTWFATKVTDVELSEKEIKKIKKGKIVDFKTLQKEIEPSLKDWGKWGHTTLWRATF
ncbi:MAG: GLPGLI family protein [Taibaiella sp.]|nr:GLPGLI family protein [Taibaiella sp.]